MSFKRLSLGSLRYLGPIGVSGLALLGLAYWLTYEPAPRVRVLWRQDVTSEQQAALERKYLLLNGRDRFTEGTLAYDLLDTSRWNIRALVEDPAVADTHDIERDTYIVPLTTDRGGEGMWIAHRIPGLRDPPVRWAAIAILAVMAVVGFRREGLAAARMAAAMAGGLVTMASSLVTTWGVHRRAPLNSRDIFDALSGRVRGLSESQSSMARWGSVPLRLVVGTLLLVAVGLPVLETWESLVLAAGCLFLVFGAPRPGAWRLPAAIVLVLAVAGLKSALPRADIAEAHNAFLVVGGGEPLERGLPAQVFKSWRAQFDAMYPKADEPPPAYSWRAEKSIPSTLYTRSTDAIWRPAKYTRQVDAIRFRTLAEFRGGFVGEMPYNFWVGDPAREAMPFYVMYELTPGSVGSQLAWTGQVFWEHEHGEFQEIVHDRPAARTIRREDVGKRVYAAFFLPHNFYFEMVPSLKLRLAGWVDGLLTLLASVLVLALTIRPRWSACLRALSIFLMGYLIITSSAAPDSARLGERYLPHSGGNDGLVHESGGRTMALLAGRGDIVKALEGTEAVYWFTPGTRYVRMVEKLTFGDTNHLFALLLAAVPIVIFYLMRHFVGASPAWVITGIFLVVPVGNPSFLQYAANARAGYGEAVGAGLFLVGLVLILYNQPGTAQRRLAQIWVGGAALAASMFVRPNFALAVAWAGCLYVWWSWTRKDRQALLAAAAGLALALWMPFHNWYYGGEVYLISRSGATMSIPLGLQDYAASLADILRGRPETPVVAATSGQIAGWLWDPGFVYTNSLRPVAWAVHFVKLFALALTSWVAWRTVARGRAQATDLAFVAGAAVFAHVPMLFIFSTQYRYGVKPIPS